MLTLLLTTLFTQTAEAGFVGAYAPAVENCAFNKDSHNYEFLKGHLFVYRSFESTGFESKGYKLSQLGETECLSATDINTGLYAGDVCLLAIADDDSWMILGLNFKDSNYSYPALKLHQCKKLEAAP